MPTNWRKYRVSIRFEASEAFFVSEEKAYKTMQHFCVSLDEFIKLYKCANQELKPETF
jgi:hypothetical protein